MHLHGRHVAERKNEACALALKRADGAEDIDRGGALIVWRARACAALCPSAGDLVLLTDAGFILEPDLYLCACGLSTCDLRQ